MDKEEVTEFQHHIRLVLGKELENPWPVLWLKTVEKVGPDDIIHPVQIYDEIAATKTVMMRHYTDDNEHFYEIALNRDLTEKEASNIVWVWEQLYDDEHGDFIIETSTPYTGEEVDKPMDVFKRNKYREFAEAVAKYQHNKWLEEKREDGWRYGITYSKNEKTHPMILPWEQLPEGYKNVDKQFPSFLDGIMNDFGFGIYIRESINNKNGD